MARKFMNKKGNLDMLWFLMIVFVMAISLFAGYKVWSLWNSNFDNVIDNSNLEQGKKDMITNLNTSFNDSMNIWDYVFLVILVISLIGIIISAYFIRSHPLYIIPFLVSLFIFFIVSIMMSNGFEIFSTGEGFDAIRSIYPITTEVMSKLPRIFVVVGIIAMIILFSKTRGGREI